MRLNHGESATLKAMLHMTKKCNIAVSMVICSSGATLIAFALLSKVD